MTQPIVRSHTNKKTPHVHLILSLAELYHRNQPGLSTNFAEHWSRILEPVLGDKATLEIAPVVHDEATFDAEIKKAEKEGADCICVVPMAYTPSRVLTVPLLKTNLPLLVLSTAWDVQLPHDMTDDYLLRNQAMHGVMDLTNTLRRHNRPFNIVAGHPQHEDFVAQVRKAVRIAAAARALQDARIGQVGTFLPGMLDITYSAENKATALGFATVPVNATYLLDSAAELAKVDLDSEREWVQNHCRIDETITEAEFEAGLRLSVALQKLTQTEQLDGVGVSFLSLLEAGAESLPFLGASRLMATGKSYAGEGDVLTAALQVALQRGVGDTGFTEWFCPDYAQNEILLSHMGECNLALAHPEKPIRIKPRKFAWGQCQRIPTPVFQMRPGVVTLISISEMPASAREKGFQLLSTRAEIIEAQEHTELSVPYSRLRIEQPLSTFLEKYSYAGGMHHVAIAYGDITAEMKMLARYTGITASEVD